VTSVAYPVEPQLPGWGHATLSLLVGWLLGGAATFGLYFAAAVAGAISTPYAADPGDLNDWPYHGDGLWTLLTNVAVIMIVLLVTTVATSTWIRRKHARVSDGRLAVVLFFTGWLPLTTAGPKGGIAGFLVALVLVRHWVTRHEGRLPIADAAVLVGILGAVVLSYGLLHPLWTADSAAVVSPSKSQGARVIVHNAARVGVTIDRIEGIPGFGPPMPSHFHLAPGADGVVTFALPRGGCGTGIFGIHARYRLLGLTLTESLPARLSLGHHC
jgi:hypothetical protein